MDYIKIFELILNENDFTVGGGSTAALSGAMACGLIAMVANLSKGKTYGYEDSKYDNIVLELNKIKEKLLQGAINDNKAYMLIVNAYKLPKNTEIEKEERKKAIQNAGIEAANVPLSNAKLNKKVFEIGSSLIGKSNPACFTDLKAGVDLSKLGLDTAKANIEVNLPLIKNEKIVEELKKQVELL